MLDYGRSELQFSITITMRFSGARRAARIVLGDVIVQKVSAEVGNAPALLLDVNVIQMFAGTAG